MHEAPRDPRAPLREEVAWRVAAVLKDPLSLMNSFLFARILASDAHRNSFQSRGLGPQALPEGELLPSSQQRELRCLN